MHRQFNAGLRRGGTDPAADDRPPERALSHRASIIPRPAFVGRETQLYEQALRRIRGGKCYFQPSLGLRELTCYFDER